MLKVATSQETPPVLEVGDIVRFERGLALITEPYDSKEYKADVLDLSTCKVVNQHTTVEMLQQRGCSVMGRIIEIIKKNTILVGE